MVNYEMWAWSVGVGRQLFDFTHDVFQAFVSIVIALVAIFIFIFSWQILEQKQSLKSIQSALEIDLVFAASKIWNQNPNVGCVFEKIFVRIGANA